jgi:hypothetical protein
MKTMSIKGEGGSIIIHVLDYERVHADNVSDANWLVAKAEVRVGDFFGRVALSLTTQNFSRFSQQLDEVLNNLKGKAIFDTDENILFFEVEMKARGTAKIIGVARDKITHSELRFAFDTDQSYLSHSHHLLTELRNDFPEIDLNHLPMP